MTDRSFNTECPVCLDEIFDENGVADEDVAETMCLHPIHSDCLSEAGRSLNSDGQRYGHGAMGPRAGCPICHPPVSSWTIHKNAGAFIGFWTERIETALQEIGPSISQEGRREPVSGEILRNKLKDDTSLTEAQKRLIRKPANEYLDMDSGFCKCLKHAGSVNYSDHSLLFSYMLQTRGIWHYNEKTDKVWLWEWGLQNPDTTTSCNHCRVQSEDLQACAGCKESIAAVMYCSKACQRSDWPMHKKDCKTFQAMKQGGTTEEKSQRLAALRN